MAKSRFELDQETLPSTNSSEDPGIFGNGPMLFSPSISADDSLEARLKARQLADAQDALAMNVAPATKPVVDRAPASVPPAPSLPAEEDGEDDEDTSPTAVAKPNPELARMKAMVDKSTGKTPVPSRMNTGDAISALLSKNSQDLDDAKEQRNKLQLVALLNNAGDTIGSALAPRGRVKPDEQFTKDMLAQAQQPVADLAVQKNLSMDALNQIKAQKELASHDPTSQESIAFRKSLSQFPTIVKSFGKDFDNISAADRDNIFNLVKLKEMQDTRRALSEQNHLVKQAKIDKEEENNLDKAERKMGEDLDPNKARTGEFGKNQGRVNAAGRIDALISRFPDYNIPKIQTVELATAVGSLLSNGSAPALAQIQELTPDTLKGASADAIAKWITGNPRGREQQEYIKQFVDTAHAERDTAADQMKDAQFQKAFTTHKHLLQRRPESFYENLATATGLPADEIKAMSSKKDFNGRYVKSSDKKDSTQPPGHSATSGSVVKIKGKTYRVGSDGDSLEEI